MIRIKSMSVLLVVGVHLAGCATPLWTSRAGKTEENTEINRGAQTNQKSSPDSGQAPGPGGWAH